MKNILVITPGVLPVPAYKGGAVEKLIQSYIYENEKKHRANLFVYTVLNDKQYDFKHTVLINVDTHSFIYKIERAIRYIINNKLPIIHIGNAYISAVCKRLKKDYTDYDVIVVENNPYAGLKLRKLFPDKKIILHLHNDYLDNNTKLAKKILDSYDKIIAISNYIKKKVETIVKTDKIEVVYNGIETEMFTNSVSTDVIQSYKEKYGIGSSDIVLLYVGRLVKEKGIKELILATNKLINTNKNVKLLIIGSKASIDSKKDKFINEINNLANVYPQNIIFTGFVEYSDLPIFYHLADIQIVPSKCGEALGNVVIEGLASGLMQIVSNDGGIPEIASEHSIIIDKENLEHDLYVSIKKIIKEKKYKIRFQNDVSKFTGEEYAKKCFEVFYE